MTEESSYTGQTAKEKNPCTRPAQH